jgi:thiol:disulfide interchange protein DsbA
MKRTLVILAAIAVALALALFLNHRAQLSVAAAASAPPAASSSTSGEQTPLAYLEGQHYKRVPHPAPVGDLKRVRIEEFFWYGCPHCLHLEALLSSWLPGLPADADFVRVPENLGRPDGIIHQRAYYAAQDLGVEPQIHLALMTALVVQHQPLITPQAIADFVAAQAHVSAADFNSQYSSFVVQGEANKANALSFDYGITGVPAIIVGGKYLVDSGLPGITSGSGNENARFIKMLKTASFLIDKVREEQAAAAAPASADKP